VKTEPPTHAPHGRVVPLGALGIVFGDIGTSPLYTLHECVHFAGEATVRPVDVLGVLSLIFWSLTMVVTLIDRAVARFELPIDCAEVTYCVGRETFLATSAGSMGVLSESLFAFLARNARSAATVFCLNPAQVIEIGSQIDL
jgi:K+ transporter